jgi:hypothetical protein
MQAISRSQLVKVNAATPRIQNAQAKPAARANAQKNTGRRFLDLLMAALSGSAV